MNDLWLAIVGGLCLAGASVVAAIQVYVLLRWPKVPARLVRYRTSRSDGSAGQRFYLPVFRFTTLEGETRTAISAWGSWRRPWERGAVLSIRYSPADSRRTQVQCFAEVWGPVLTLAGLGLWCCAFYAGLFGWVLNGCR